MAKKKTAWQWHFTMLDERTWELLTLSAKHCGCQSNTQFIRALAEMAALLPTNDPFCRTEPELSELIQEGMRRAVNRPERS